jgi:hypothetical protein
MSKLKVIALKAAVGVLTAIVLTVQPAVAAETVNINVNPNTSTPGGIVPDVNGVNAVYNYTIYDGQGVSDTIPVQVCMTGSSDDDWTSIVVTFGTVSGNLSGVTLPADQTFLASAATPDCRNLNIQIDTGVLTLTNPNVAQNFVGNIGLGENNPLPATGSNKPNVSFADVKNIQIKIEVLPAQSNVSCYLTDSEGIFLKDCNGAFVTESGSDDGRFAIVANKKLIEVATNPGQFYFNFIWVNTTGVDQTVTVTFERTGVVAHGMQAIHSAVFNGYLSTVNPPAFDEANANGIPDGHDDVAEDILVPAGSSLLVTYHLAWAGLGSPVPAGCAGACADANQLLQVTGTVTGAGITSESCTATAYGFKK